MEKIKYEIESYIDLDGNKQQGLIVTQCPHGQGCAVGSASCTNNASIDKNCEYFKKVNIEERYVICEYIKKQTG